MIAGCDGVLLPGSNADVDPAKFNAARSPHTAAPTRDAMLSTTSCCTMPTPYASPYSASATACRA